MELEKEEEGEKCGSMIYKKGLLIFELYNV